MIDTIIVEKSTAFEEFPIGISICDKDSISYISEKAAKELYWKLGEVLEMDKVDEEKLNELYDEYRFNKNSPFSIEEDFKAGYRKAKEE